MAIVDLFSNRQKRARGEMPDVYAYDGAIISQTYTAVTKKVGGWWVVWIEEIPSVHCQEPTREAVLETLAITLREAIAFNQQEVLVTYSPSHLGAVT